MKMFKFQLKNTHAKNTEGLKLNDKRINRCQNQYDTDV